MFELNSSYPRTIITNAIFIIKYNSRIDYLANSVID